MKKVTALFVTVVLAMGLFAFTGCRTDSDEMYIGVVSKGFQHQFWQAVRAGSDAAAAELGVRIFFTGPEGESAIADQIIMIDAELAKNPAALALAALDTEAVLTQLLDAYNRNIPVIGFDSGVPGAPAGHIAANASTDNDGAAALGAEHLFEALKDQIAAATPENPVVISILSQDVTSASIQGRTRGFAIRMCELVEELLDGECCAIRGGYAAINKGDAGTAPVIIDVIVGATPEITDMTNAANGLLNTENLIGVFCSNEGAVMGLLAAINAGARVPDGVLLVGFDAGAAQKDAVRSGLFMGAITQDPFQIGYMAVELAVRAARGEAVEDVDTGAKWWDASNMDDEDIALLLYD